MHFKVNKFYLVLRYELIVALQNFIIFCIYSTFVLKIIKQFLQRLMNLHEHFFKIEVVNIKNFTSINLFSKILTVTQNEFITTEFDFV